MTWSVSLDTSQNVNAVLHVWTCGHRARWSIPLNFYSAYYQTKLTALGLEPLTPLRNADRQLFLDQLQCSMTTSFCFCACGNTIRSRFHYFSMAFVRVHLCVCVCAHALNLMKGIFCSSQSQVIFFFQTHTHTDHTAVIMCMLTGILPTWKWW